MKAAHLLFTGVVALQTGCIPSNVVAADDRAVTSTLGELIWSEPLPTSLAGLYESVRIDGEIAHGMWKVYYHFAATGGFTGAALVLDTMGPAFQTLTGQYSIADGRIRLGIDAEPATLSAAPGHIRIGTDDGVIVLRRAGD